MRFFPAVFLLAAAFGQPHPNFSGTWQLDAEKTKLPPGAPQRMLLKIDHRDPKMDGIILVWNAGGNQLRNEFHYTTSGEETTEPSRGLHLRGEWEGSELVIATTFTVDGKEQKNQARFSLSADGKVLTMTQSNGTASLPLILKRAAPELAAEFDKPEKKAAQAYLNVRLLGDLSETQFMETMNVYRHSLGVNCDHCHADRAFEKDEKPAKETARKMIAMVRELNQKLGANKVSCWTCHRGSVLPAVAP